MQPMSQWATVDGPVLHAVWEVLQGREHATENAVLAALGWADDRRLVVMRSMKLLIDSGHLEGRVNTGDATILDVVVTGVTEKGLKRLGQWQP